MVKLAQRYLLRSKHVEKAVQAEQRAQDVIVTVNAVQNATNDLGKLWR